MQAYGTFEVVKKNKRLWIQRVETGELVYTPPNFISLHSREPLQHLARDLGQVPLSSGFQEIMRFESYNGPKKQLVVEHMAYKAAEMLNGTSKGMADLGEEFETLEATSKTFCSIIDQEIFRCEVCDWWCEQSEMAERSDERWICEECSDQEEDEE